MRRPHTGLQNFESFHIGGRDHERQETRVSCRSSWFLKMRRRMLYCFCDSVKSARRQTRERDPMRRRQILQKR